MTSSFIICTKNRPDDLRDCMVSIAEQNTIPEEVIVVDASDERGSAENKKQGESILSGKTKFIYVSSEPSTTRQRNIGVEKARGDIVLFLDDDVVLNNDYHKNILEIYEIKKDCNLGGVQGSYTNYLDYFESSWIERTFKKIFLMEREALKGRGRMMPSFNPFIILDPDDIIEVEFMPTCLCSYLREVFNEFKFDESLDKYALGEDKELSYRVSRKYKLFQTPYARLYHKKSPAVRLDRREYRKKQIINLHYMAKKNILSSGVSWIAVYWSIVGLLLFCTIKSLRSFDNNEFSGALEGVKSIMVKKSATISHN